MNTRPTSWWLRAASTPVGDALRGRLTASLDWRGRLQESGLPIEARELVATVIRKTRLWRSEKADVALELSAHFHDGLAQGQTGAQLVAAFGAASQAARLIRRAKRRLRPWAWKIGHRAAQAAGVLLLLYLGLIAQTLSRHPSPNVDYLAKVNAATHAALPADSAWPLYRELWTQYAEREMSNRVLARPGEAGWEATKQLVRQNADWLRAAREAAAKPALGLPLGFAWDYRPEDARVLFGENWIPGTPPAEDDPERLESECLVSVLLPHLARLKGTAQWLGADLVAAGEEGEGARVVEDYQAILGVARHSREHPILINQLVAIADVAIGNAAAAQVLHRYPEALSAGELTQLAHALSTSRDLVGVDFGGERMLFMDIVQRVYSDDGRGDGKMTLEGLRLLRRLGWGPEDLGANGTPGGYAEILGASDLGSRAASAVVSPLAAEVLASRRDLVGEYNRLMALLEAEARQPLWVRLHQASEFERELMGLMRSPTDSLRYVQIRLLVPAISGAAMKSDESVAFSEALMAVAALEVYHRRNGSYPESLKELTPRWLPFVPQDASTGQPLLYRLQDGQPVLYGRGFNGVDNGGFATEKATQGWPRLHFDAAGEGDWVLYPPPERAPRKG